MREKLTIIRIIAIGEETSSLSDAGKSLLPSQNALKLMYERQRFAPPIPQTVEDSN